MRLDKYLKVSRIIKRRTVAAEAAETGHVIVDGRPAKPSTAVKPGSVLEITFGDRVKRYEVLSCPETVGKAEASNLYKELD